MSPSSQPHTDPQPLPRSQPLISVEEALWRMLRGVAPTLQETILLDKSGGRVLRQDLSARLSQPPFATSSMDGYALRASDTGSPPVRLRVVGESAAGHAFAGPVGAREAVRIFTGAPMPTGTDSVLMQEQANREGDFISLAETIGEGENVRAEGMDFKQGETLLAAGRELTARDLMLAAAMGHGQVLVSRQPTVAILATGDELVPPGAERRADQIVSSVPYGLGALVSRFGGLPHKLPIAKDTPDSLSQHFEASRSLDVLVTIGGASVGDHDLVHQTLRRHGVEFDFWRIAMRPGKPLMFGRQVHDSRTRYVLGVPGNPVSALICARVFLVPLLDALLGRQARQGRDIQGELAGDLPANGPRQHFMRAKIEVSAGHTTLIPAHCQDSSLQSTLAAADALIVREPHAPPAKQGEIISARIIDF